MITLSLSKEEANALLLAIEAAMSKLSESADTVESEVDLKRLDSLWSRVMDAGIEKGFGGPKTREASAYLDLMQCSEV